MAIVKLLQSKRFASAVIATVVAAIAEIAGVDLVRDVEAFTLIWLTLIGAYGVEDAAAALGKKGVDDGQAGEE